MRKRGCGAEEFIGERVRWRAAKGPHLVMARTGGAHMWDVECIKRASGVLSGGSDVFA